MTAAGFPDVLARISFVSDYTDTTPTWEDVSAYLKSFSITRGRQTPSRPIEPSMFSGVFRNHDDRFNADNTAGPYYGYIRPNRRISVVATVSATPYPLITAYADKFTFPPETAEGRITATDRFKLLAKRTTTISRPDESVEDRLTALCEVSGGATVIVGSVDREINPDAFATRTVATYDYDEFNSLQALTDAAHADGGQLFLDGSGVLRYQSVKFLQTGGATRALTSQARLGNDPTSIPAEADVEPGVDQSLMANRITVTDCNAEVKTAEDTALHDPDGILDDDLGGTLLLSSDAQDRVDDDLALRKSPTPRYEYVTVNMLCLSAAEQATILGLEISDRITLAIYTPPTRTSGWERDQWIEGIDHNVQITGEPSWMVTFRLSSCGGSATAIP